MKNEIDSKLKVFYSHINDNKSVKFQYGKFDCLSFISSFYKKIIQFEYGDEYTGTYKSKKQYFMEIKKNGFTSINKICNKHFDKINIKNAARMDLMMYKGALGLCDGYNSIFLSNIGYEFINTHLCKYAWRVLNCHK